MANQNKLKKLVSDDSTDVCMFRKLIDSVVTGNLKVMVQSKASKYNWFKSRMPTIEASETQCPTGMSEDLQADELLQVQECAAQLDSHKVDLITLFDIISKADLVFDEIAELEAAVIALQACRKNVKEAINKAKAGDNLEKQKHSMQMVKEFKPFQDGGMNKKLLLYIREKIRANKVDH